MCLIPAVMPEGADRHRETQTDQPFVVAGAARDPVSAEGARVSAEATLMILTEEEFTMFYLRCFYADHPLGGVRQNCQDSPWFPRVAHLFSGEDGDYVSEEAARAAGKIARQRGLVLSSEGPSPSWSYFPASSKPASTANTVSPS